MKTSSYPSRKKWRGVKNSSPQKFETEIKEYFFSSGKQITPEALQKIYSIAHNHPFYTQVLATHSCWRTQFICTDQTVQASLEGIIESINGETIFIDPILEYWLANYYFDLPLNFDPPIYLKLPAYRYS